MATVSPKVHRHRRRRSESRQRQCRNIDNQQQLHEEEQQMPLQSLPQPQPEEHYEEEQQHQLQLLEDNQQQEQEQEADIVAVAPTSRSSLSCENMGDVAEATSIRTSIRGGMSRTTSAGTTNSTVSQSSSQQTVLLVNGEVPSTQMVEPKNVNPITVVVIETNETNEITEITLNELNQNAANKDTTQPTGGGNSSRNSSGDAQSLRETLQQLRPPMKKSNASVGIGANAYSASVVPSSAQQHRSHHHHHHHHHRERERDRQHRTRSPRETSASGSANSTVGGSVGGYTTSERVGILGFMEREMRQCSPTPSTARSIPDTSGTVATDMGTGTGTGTGARKLPSSLSDDPQASPAQRSIRSRSSLEKSPRRKRSKSESRRRRERKLIAAGEMEVRQANETLMRYLKQCSEMNDASLSGELEIDQSYDERRVQRKTKSQRDKRGHLISKLYTAGGGLSSLLRELSDDIVPAEGEEIYNPFTPVVSPTEDNAPAHIDKMFMQTSSGYRPVERCYYKHHHHHHIVTSGNVGGGGGGIGGNGGGAVCNTSIVGGHAGGNNGTGSTNISGIAAFIGPNLRGRQLLGVGGGRESNGGGSNASFGGLRRNGSYDDDVHCLLEADECNSHEIRTNIQLACVVQRIWLLVANICHGLLAGLALAHLLFVLSSPHPIEWAKILISQMNTLSGETTTASATTVFNGDGSSAGNGSNTSESTASSIVTSATTSHEIISDYASFANIYLNTFYCMAIICLVSVLDRMDICRWDLSNASEFISFRWLIIAMIYIATIILTICSDTIDEKLYYNSNANVSLTEREMFSNSILNVWSSLSVTRSISAICGWVMIGLTPHEDLLYEQLIDLTKYQLTNN